MVTYYTYLELYIDDLTRRAGLNEFEKHFKKPHQTIKSRLKHLVKDKILNEKKKGRFLFYSLNKENPLLFEYLSICEKERLFKFLKKPIFNRLYNLMAAHFKNNKTLIFGSAATGKDFSDIDILILSKDKKILKTLKDFEKTYSVKLHILQTEQKDITQSFINEIKRKHIILNNHDYFLRLFYEDEL